MRSADEGIACKSKPKLYRYFHILNSTNTTLITQRETIAEQVVFHKHIHNINSKNKPVLIVCFLVEFGCESLLPHYFINKFLQDYKAYHLVAVGWYGRSFFYEKFDEFWELDQEFMYMRDYCLAFSHVGRNIKNIEKCLKKYGVVYPSNALGNIFHHKKCKKCGHKTLPMSDKVKCAKCSSDDLEPSLLENPQVGKQQYFKLNLDLSKYENFLNSVIKSDKVIGIFARNRVTYGRNLPIEFYKKFIDVLLKKGYQILWLGERQSVHACPNTEIFDFTTTSYADDVGACLALVGKCKATFQAWTASTRFAQLMDIPYCLVESNDQINGKGHEGKRLILLTPDMNKKKIIISNFDNSKKNLDQFFEVCIFNFLDFIENKNSNTVVGLL